MKSAAATLWNYGGCINQNTYIYFLKKRQFYNATHNTMINKKQKSTTKIQYKGNGFLYANGKN